MPGSKMNTINHADTRQMRASLSTTLVDLRNGEVGVVDAFTV